MSGNCRYIATSSTTILLLYTAGEHHFFHIRAHSLTTTSAISYAPTSFYFTNHVCLTSFVVTCPLPIRRRTVPTSWSCRYFHWQASLPRSLALAPLLTLRSMFASSRARLVLRLARRRPYTRSPLTRAKYSPQSFGSTGACFVRVSRFHSLSGRVSHLQQ